ncbi:hypothetical protein VPNG_09874 [Cytospora leucostoma]|uniref:Uncharacterized protein n=1 Tax=Cytospora leucostoma TaxID=1230097 RepID=A0A423VNR1_9PEZI|nr:hypothetical protein VPNG_09874 [Cytospora leucostoma]
MASKAVLNGSVFLAATVSRQLFGPSWFEQGVLARMKVGLVFGTGLVEAAPERTTGEYPWYERKKGL